MRNRFDRPFLAAVLLACSLVLSIADGADPDLWGHVRYGADVLRDQALPSTTTYAYTVPNHPWINHELASELAFATLDRLGGGTALTAFKTFLGLAVLALVIGTARRAGATPLVIAGTSLLAAVNLSPGWTVRPQIFSYAAFTLMIVLLDTGRRDPRALVVLPLLFVAWVNTHAGFVAGLVVLVLYLGADLIERARRGDPDIRRAGLRAGMVGLACALAILCTPYGLAFVPWLVHAVTLARPAISEWQPMRLADPQFVPFALLVLLIVIAWLRSPRAWPLAHTLVLLAVGWASWRHSRHAAFLAILGGLWLPPHLEAMRRRPSPTGSAAVPTPASDTRRSGATVVAASAWLACAVLALAVTTRVRPPWVHRAYYPVEAFAFMRQHGLTGNLLAQFDWAQYAIYAFAPATRVAFDGRFETAYPGDVADMHFDFLLGDVPERAATGDGARMLERGRPDLVLVDRDYPHAVEIMRARPEWVLLYQDGLAALWGRATRYDDPAGTDYLPPATRPLSDTPPTGRVPWPASP